MDSKLTRIIRKLALFFGIALLVISIYLSFDGFDGSVNGENGHYTELAVIIGVVFAITVTIIQFIFTSEYKSLNPTLIVVGLLSYAYSIYTNKLGAENILGMSGIMAWVTAVFSDIVAEPMISWGMGESLIGDLIGNVGKALVDDGKNAKPKQNDHNQKSKYQPKHKPSHMQPTFNQGFKNNYRPQQQQPAQRRREPTYHPVGMRDED